RFRICGPKAAKGFGDFSRRPLGQIAVRGLEVRSFLLGRWFLLRLWQFLRDRLRSWFGRFSHHVSGIMASMSHDNDPNTEPTLFSAVITPHRSLSSTGFLLVMLLVGGMSLIGGLFFFLIGAWPVVGFLGLDVLLVYLAFRINYRAANAYEQVTMTTSEL